MTSIELKHQARLQEWAGAIQDCRSSGLSVKQWCRERKTTPTTYYRWERELLSLAANSTPETEFAELPASAQSCLSETERTATLRVGNGSIDRVSYSCIIEDTGRNALIMLSDFTGASKVYIACGYTDLRRGIDGPAIIVQQQFQLDPFTNTLFLLCGKRRDRIKALQAKL